MSSLGRAERCVSVLAGFEDHVERLVHEIGRASSADRVRHRTFLLTRFGLFFIATSGWIVSLALGHVPLLWDALAVAWLTVPLVAAVYTSRTGRLVEGEAACLIAWCGLAITTTLGGGTSLFGGCVVLLVGPLEAIFAGRARHVNAALAAAIVGALGLGAAQLAGLLHAADHGMAVGDAVVAVPALLFVVVLARGALSLRQHHERKVAQEEERYRVLAETVGDLVLRFDRAGRVLTASRSAEQLLGVAPRDLLGRSFVERVHVTDRPALLMLLADAAASGDTGAARLRLRTAFGDREGSQPESPCFAWSEIRARRFDRPADREAEPDEAPVIIGVVRNIDAQMAREQEIEKAKEDAERVSLWKDAFLANVSHELRTPLNAVIGFSELLASEEFRPRDPAKQREYARIIATSGQHLLSVVNSLLDMSKIEAGRFEVNPEPFAIAPMISTCCDMIGLKAEQAGIALICEVAPTLDEIVGDRRACKQIVLNLLSNALKFTPRDGSVTITARPDGTAVLLTVTDTGVGIAARDLQRLGDAFFQVQSGLDRPFEGTGLGLSVVRGLVGLHGGTITLASAPGEGTQVTVRLPLDCRSQPGSGTSVAIETIARYSRARPSRLPTPVKVQKVA